MVIEAAVVVMILVMAASAVTAAAVVVFEVLYQSNFYMVDADVSDDNSDDYKYQFDG